MNEQYNAIAISAEPLVAISLCDACHTRAQYRISLPFGELDFCGHHFNENKGRLLDLAGQIIGAPEGYVHEQQAQPVGQWSQLELPFGDGFKEGQSE